MAVERKDRFVELLRDQNDNLKEKLLRLQETSRKEDRTRESRVYLVKQLPLLSNVTVWRDTEKKKNKKERKEKEQLRLSLKRETRSF